MQHRIFALGLLALFASHSQAAMVSGDMVFTSFNADEDGFSLATFVDINPNTTLYFTDNEWNGLAIGAGGAFNIGESYTQWNSGMSLIHAGSLIRFSAVDTASLASSIGTYSRVSVSGSSNYGIANSNETLYAYLGTSATAPSLFLSAITNSNFDAADGSIVNTGLVQNLSAIDLNGSATTSPDYGAYNGPRTGFNNFAAYKPLVGNTALWTLDATNGDYKTTVPNTTAFSLTPVSTVPVPASLWLFSSALLGVLGLRRRR